MQSTKRVRTAADPDRARNPILRTPIYQEPSSAAPTLECGTDQSRGRPPAVCVSVDASATAHAQPDGLSGRVRCGVGDSECTRTAVEAAVGAAIEPYVGLVPQRTLRQLLEATSRQGRIILAELPLALGGAAGPEGGAGAGGGAAEAGGGSDVYHSVVSEVIRSVVACVTDTADALLTRVPVMVWPRTSHRYLCSRVAERAAVSRVS